MKIYWLNILKRPKFKFHRRWWYIWLECGRARLHFGCILLWIYDNTGPFSYSPNSHSFWMFGKRPWKVFIENHPKIPGGFLADKFGARVLLSAGMLCTSFLTLFTAIVADWGPDWLIALRILEGLGEGVTYPAAASFWARWAPAHERSRMIGFCFAGAQMGTVLAIPLTGLLIEIRNDSLFLLKVQ